MFLTIDLKQVHNQYQVSSYSFPDFLEETKKKFGVRSEVPAQKLLLKMYW